MPSLLRKRLLASITDLAIIGLYIMLLYIVFSIIRIFTDQEPVILHPVAGQAIGFFMLTLPVFLYYYLAEKNYGKTLGKKWNNLQLAFPSAGQSSSVLIRNILKLLPWEIAHIGVHWLIYYIREGITDTPVWIMLLLIIPQLVVLLYAVGIFQSKGKTSLYDKIAGTEITEITVMQNK